MRAAVPDSDMMDEASIEHDNAKRLEAIEPEIDPSPEVRPHMLQLRRSLLENMERVARDWDMVFRAMTANGDAAQGLSKSRTRLAGQRGWAIKNLRQLNDLQDMQKG